MRWLISFWTVHFSVTSSLRDLLEVNFGLNSLLLLMKLRLGLSYSSKNYSFYCWSCVCSSTTCPTLLYQRWYSLTFFNNSVDVSHFFLQIRSIFVVLSDDMFRQILRKFEKNKKSSGSRPESSAPTPSGSGSSTSASPPAATGTTPPPAAAPTLASRVSKSRTQKRGASSDSGPSAKK